jgi:hypothetical protein
MVLTALAVTAGPASAQNTLNYTDPMDGATLVSAPPAITLVFGETLDQARTKVTITGPQGQSAGGTSYADGLTVSTDFVAGPDGPYTVDYTVNSQDGNPLTGQLHFTLATKRATSQNANPAQAASGANAATPSSATTAPTTTRLTNIGSGTSGHLPAVVWWPWVVVGVLVLAGLALIFWRRRGGTS